IQSDLSSLWDMVIDGIKDYLVETIVTQAVLRIATMFNPVGALLNAIVTVWNVYNFLRDNIQRIWGVVTSVVNMIAQIAAGVIQPAVQAVEQAIASLVPIAISLLANLLGLSGLTAKVREFIEGVQQMVRNAIVNLIRRVRSMFSGGQGAQGEDGENAAGGDTVLGEDAAVSGGGESHTVHIETRGQDAEVQVRSTPTPAETFIQNITSQEPWSGYADDEEFQEKKQAALTLASQVNTEADQLASQMAAHMSSSSEPPTVEDDSVEAKQARLAAALSEMLRYGQPALDGIPPAFEPHLDYAHPQARSDIRDAVVRLFPPQGNLFPQQGGPPQDSDWATALPHIKSGLSWWSTPLNNGPTFAEWAVSNQAEPAALNAAHEVKADDKALPDSFANGNVTPAGASAYVNRSKGGIHGRDAAVSALQGEVFDVGQQNGVEGILKVQYREMLEGSGGNTTSNDEKVTGYRAIITGISGKGPPRTLSVSEPTFGTPPTDEQVGTFRERLRSGVVAAYRGNVAQLHDHVISSGVIPSKYNRIKGDIFEQWLVANVPGVLDRTPYILKASNTSEVEAMADGMIEGGAEAEGSTLVEAKAYVGTSGPSNKEKAQMTRYAATLGVKKWLLRSGDERMFSRVHYYFSADTIAAKFWPSLQTLIPASKRGVFVGSASWAPSTEADDAEASGDTEPPNAEEE
ncbi:MAG: hypothetical protein AAF449_19400, partial [Myxococcota bacterium]